MKSKLLILLTILVNISFGMGQDTTIKLSKNDFLEFKIGVYINGFKEFDNSIVIIEKTIRISLYYDQSTQKKSRVEQLKKRFEKTIPPLLNKYSWGKKYKLVISIYSEDKEERGY